MHLCLCKQGPPMHRPPMPGGPQGFNPGATPFMPSRGPGPSRGPARGPAHGPVQSNPVSGSSLVSSCKTRPDQHTSSNVGQHCMHHCCHIGPCWSLRPCCYISTLERLPCRKCMTHRAGEVLCNTKSTNMLLQTERVWSVERYKASLRHVPLS